MSDIIMVGIDGSEGSNRALDYAITTSKESAQQILLIAVIPHSPHAFLSVRQMESNDRWRKEQTEHAENDVLAPAKKRVEAAQLSCSTRILFGNPAEAISQVAKENSVSRIVVGRRGQSQFKALVFGSVSGSLAQISPVPVVVVP